MVPIFQNNQTTDCLYDITLIFDRCSHSSAEEIPDKYECIWKYVIYTFAKSKFPTTEKWTNGTLVPPPLYYGRYALEPCVTRWTVHYTCAILVSINDSKHRFIFLLSQKSWGIVFRACIAVKINSWSHIMIKDRIWSNVYNHAMYILAYHFLHDCLLLSGTCACLSANGGIVQHDSDKFGP